MNRLDHISDDCIRIGNKLYNAKKIEAWHPGGKIFIQEQLYSLTDRILPIDPKETCSKVPTPMSVTFGHRRGGEIHAA